MRERRGRRSDGQQFFSPEARAAPMVQMMQPSPGVFVRLPTPTPAGGAAVGGGADTNSSITLRGEQVTPAGGRLSRADFVKLRNSTSRLASDLL
jgi:hypothetical protein